MGMKEVIHSEIQQVPKDYVLDGMLQNPAFDEYYYSVLETLFKEPNMECEFEKVNPVVFAIVINQTILTPDGLNNLCNFTDTPHKYLMVQNQIKKALEDDMLCKLRLPPMSKSWVEKRNENAIKHTFIEQQLKNLFKHSDSK